MNSTKKSLSDISMVEREGGREKAEKKLKVILMILPTMCSEGSALVVRWRAMDIVVR
jgi:hypothetical protein